MSEVVSAPNSVLVSFIERAARDPEFDVQKFGELLRMQREVEHEQARKSFNRAMAAAQADMLPIVRDAKNTHLNNKYAKLETIDAAIRPIYTAHGFSVRYGSAPSPHEGVMRITCTVAHDSGYFEENYLDAPVTTTGSQGGKMAITPVQAIGSTVTYLRRYLLGMVWNAVLSDDDDDGEATRRPPRQDTRQPPPAPWLKPLEEQNGAVWLKNLDVLLANAQSRDEVTQIAAHYSVGNAIAKAPNGTRARISEMIVKASGKFMEADTQSDEPEDVAIAGEEKVGAG